MYALLAILNNTHLIYSRQRSSVLFQSLLGTSMEFPPFLLFSLFSITALFLPVQYSPLVPIIPRSDTLHNKGGIYCSPPSPLFYIPQPLQSLNNLRLPHFPIVLLGHVHSMRCQSTFTLNTIITLNTALF